jgi:hypothetical protein
LKSPTADDALRIPHAAILLRTSRRVCGVLQIVLCKLKDHADQELSGLLDLKGPPQEHILKWYTDQNLLPNNPARFSSQPTFFGRGTTSPRVRVLIEERTGTVRNFLNLSQLVNDCNSDSRWECRAFRYGSGFARSARAIVCTAVDVPHVPHAMGYLRKNVWCPPHGMGWAPT